VIEAAVAFVVSDVPVEQAVQTVRRNMQRSILLLDDIIGGVMVLLPIRDWGAGQILNRAVVSCP
jgi:hypothetical protein